jgi:hypothetical protein
VALPTASCPEEMFAGSLTGELRFGPAPGGWGRHHPSKPALDPITDSEGGDSKPAIEVITDLSASKPGCGPASNCEPYRELIALELERGRNAMGIWQDLVDSHGFTGGLPERATIRAQLPPSHSLLAE